MKIKNTIDEDLTLNFKGVDYPLAAGVVEDFPEDVAAQWLRIYDFLSVAKATDKEVNEVVKEITGKDVKEPKDSKKKSSKTNDK
jgi:hypothetical protein